jgi:hypothetical protein
MRNINSNKKEKHRLPKIYKLFLKRNQNRLSSENYKIERSKKNKCNKKALRLLKDGKKSQKALT